MDNKINLFKESWQSKEYVLAVIQSIAFLLFALIINYYAVRFATDYAGLPLQDRLFALLPYFDLSFIDKHVAFFAQGLLVVFALFEVRRTVFLFNVLALLIIVRAFFINLTGLGVPEGAIQTVSFFTQGGDLFFSGHVAIPFLAFLVYYHSRKLRYIFLGVTIFMALEVLVGRYHYSIDVFAAPFIVYGVYALCKNYLFKKWYTE
jgi:hypothetical protein